VILCAWEEHWQVLFYFCLGGLTVIWPRWLQAFYFAPLVLAGYLAGHRLLYEHVQEPSRERSLEETARSTRDHHLGWAGRMLIAPHHVGYHRIHHLHPQAALENLPELSDWYAAHRSNSGPV
jgi:fatty acid desaturase